MQNDNMAGAVRGCGACANCERRQALLDRNVEALGSGIAALAIDAKSRRAPAVAPEAESPANRMHAKLGALETQLRAKIARIEDTCAPLSARVFVRAPSGVAAREDAVLARMVDKDALEWQQPTMRAQEEFYHALHNAVRRVRPPGAKWVHEAYYYSLRAKRLRRDVEDALDRYYATMVAHAAHAPTASQ